MRLGKTSDKQFVDAATLPHECMAIQANGRESILVSDTLREVISEELGSAVSFYGYPVGTRPHDPAREAMLERWQPSKEPRRSYHYSSRIAETQYFKVERFEEERPGKRFPNIRAIPPGEAAALSQKISPLVRSKPTMTMMLTLDPSPDTFSLKDVWAAAKVTPLDTLYLSFDPLPLDPSRTIDRMRRVDVEEFFSYIWYAGTDDLYLFDDSALWLVYINRGGCIFFTRAESSEGHD